MKLGPSLLMLAIAGSVVPDAAAGQKARPDPVAVPVAVPTKVQLDRPMGIAVDRAGNVYVADFGFSKTRKITLSGEAATLASGQDRPLRVATDSAGNVYISGGDDIIRKIDPSGTETTLGGRVESGRIVDRAFSSIGGMVVDKAGNIYVTNYSDVRKLTPAGVVSTIAGAPGKSGSADGAGSFGRFNYLKGITIDGAGNLYVADKDNHTIRKITPAGVVSTLAGVAGEIGDADGAGSAARFYSPEGVATDSAGNVYVADSGNGSIRKISPEGLVTTLAGTAEAFGIPMNLAVDQSDNLYVSDFHTSAIQKITPRGEITVFAGTPDESGKVFGDTLCRFNEAVYFSCHIKGGKTVSICGSKIVNDKRGYLQYRNGKRNAIELELPKQPDAPSKFFTGAADRGGRMMQAYLRIRNGEYAYVVYDSQGVGSELLSGVAIEKNNKIISNKPCEGISTGQGIFGVTGEPVTKQDAEGFIFPEQ